MADVGDDRPSRRIENAPAIRRDEIGALGARDGEGRAVWHE